MNTIGARRWKMIGHPELHRSIPKCMVEEEGTTGRPRNSYKGQIKN